MVVEPSFFCWEWQKNNKIKNIPALIINDNVISEGKVLSAKEIIRVIKTEAVC